MAAPDFYGPKLKIERAEHHIDQLKIIFRRFVSDNMKRLRPQYKQRALKEGRSAALSTFPKHTPTILGDAIHNLRVALDHTYHIVCEANGAIFDKYRRFPFGGDPNSIRGSINGHKAEGKAPSDKVINAIIDDIQPYPQGKFRLYGLHDLDITDKHLLLIPTTISMAIEKLSVVDEKGKDRFITIKGINFTMDNPEKGGDFISFGDNRNAIIEVGRGGAVLQGDPKTAFQIVFAKG